MWLNPNPIPSPDEVKGLCLKDHTGVTLLYTTLSCRIKDG